MKLKVVYILLFAVGFSTAMKAQLNDYKYIIVPKSFSIFKKENEYQTSTLIKHYFVQNGFNAVYEDELPDDLITNRCLGLEADLINNSSLFTTKTSIALKDCHNVEVFRSLEGTSKIKEYAGAYKEAIQQAFVSFAGLDYSYQPKQTETPKDPVVISFKDDVKTVVEKEKDKVVEQKATTEEQVYKSVEPRPSNFTKSLPTEGAKPVTVDLLYAQPIENGYQLVDSTPKVVLKLESTSMDNVFLTQFEGNNAVVFNKDGKWILEYQENGNKHQKELNIKF
ncbi:hypothetical protein [Flagellimonas sediminis]|uniref:Uncharacterized protein n=1 Tax=Flagellimonas sediminis TaxID=2696468 RepID=A0A6I5KZE8_9FLAO|nr:hypothetical protein [Allomuricauda sediminis]NDV43712.1 hypothetical protein [Allomuricauda sediminis]